jgi:hypothetical protein
MSIVTNPLTGTTAGTEYSQELAPGILVSLAAFQQPPTTIPLQVWVAIGVKSQETSLDARRVQLAEGYTDQATGVTWTGIYPIASGDRMYMLIKGISETPLELTERRLTGETQIIPGVTLAQLLKTIIARP